MRKTLIEALGFVVPEPTPAASLDEVLVEVNWIVIVSPEVNEKRKLLEEGLDAVEPRREMLRLVSI